MDFLDKRIKGICDQLIKWSVKKKLPCDNLLYKKGNFIYPKDAHNDATPFEKFDSKNMHWYGPDEHYWFTFEYTVPESLDGKPMWLHVRTQIEEWDDAKNPQFLLFVNNEAVQGIDMNHRDVFIEENAVAGTKYTFDLQSYTGTLHTEFNLIIEMQEVDPEILGLYYDLKVPINGFARMDKQSKAYMDLERELNNTINLLDLRTPYSQEFYTSLDKAREYIAQEVYTNLAGNDDVIATCIGHTHIDIAWWWTVEQTREKVARSFSTVLKLMEEYPNYTFMSSQPQLYAFLKERYPDIYAKVKQRIDEKRWEPEGGMWLEADCNLTSGESLVRQFIHGKRFFKEEFGVDNKILWLPDVFGYSGALPQIMEKCGIEYFMTTKLAWNQFNQMPDDTFIWRGIDGTETLTHLITTSDVGQSEDRFYTTYNGFLHPDAIIGGWKRYQNKDINNDILVSFGHGDGGGGPTREMLETSLRMEKGVNGLPKVRQVFSRTYFDELNERVKDNNRLATWDGELYFEYHRGTYTSMARNKRSNRKAELHMMDLELFSILAKKLVEYPAEQMDRLWKGIMLNQFHDILPGTSIHEVYEVTKREYEAIEKEIEDLQNKSIDAILDNKEALTVFNTTGFNRDDVVCLGECEASAVKDASGEIYPVQQTQDGAVAFVKNIPSKGYKTLTKVDSDKVKSPFILKDNFTLETPFYSIKLDENALISSIFDKEADREIIQDNQKANLFRMYEDKPIYFDNWDIDIYYTEKSWDITDFDEMKWIENGPVAMTLQVKRSVSNSVITQKIHFYADSRRIDFDTNVDWKEHQHLLKVHFPISVHTNEATFDIQFGNVTRKFHTNTSWDKARFESCGQKWIDLSEGHYGVSLLNDCKYGHSIKDSNIGLTLIKSGIEPNPVTDCEMHYFTYSLYPHMGSWRENGTVQQAYNVNQPVISKVGATKSDEFSLVSSDKINAVVETIKASENGQGTIIRLYECDNALTKVNLTFNGEFKNAFDCNLLEEIQSELEVNNNTISFTIKPYEIKTILVK